MSKITRHDPNLPVLLTDRQMAVIDTITSTLDEAFPKDGDITVVIIACKKDDLESDIFSRFTCPHCLWKLFMHLSEVYLGYCIEEGLVGTIAEDNETRH